MESSFNESNCGFYPLYFSVEISQRLAWPADESPRPVPATINTVEGSVVGFTALDQPPSYLPVILR
jgi:hypothetical protein